jgi:hypothetical protein
MFATVLVSVGVLGASADWPTPQMLKASVARSLPLLQRAAATHAEQKTCFGCHNQGPPLRALRMGAERGFAVPESFFAEQRAHILAFVKENQDKFSEGKGTGGQADTAGSILLALEHAGHKSDERSTAIVDYFLKYQAKQDHYTCTSTRPPSEASHFATTFLGVRGLQHWATPEQRESAQKRIAEVRKWIEKAKPKDTEDRVFRLIGLHEAGADSQQIATAAKDLLAQQRLDGGWNQLPEMASDAYATGTALVALVETGMLKTSDPAYRRGVRYLLSQQLQDGSWHVVTRSKPFQKYYESGFPHGKDQFISAAASGWATAALLLDLPKK